MSCICFQLLAQKLQHMRVVNKKHNNVAANVKGHCKECMQHGLHRLISMCNNIGCTLPRIYMPQTPGTRNYAINYTKSDLEQAVTSVHTDTSIRQAAKDFNITVGPLHNKVHRKHQENQWHWYQMKKIDLHLFWRHFPLGVVLLISMSCECGGNLYSIRLDELYQSWKTMNGEWLDTSISEAA